MPVELWNKKRKCTARQPNPAMVMLSTSPLKIEILGIARQSCSKIDNALATAYRVRHG
jgi:hypothetical protein